MGRYDKIQVRTTDGFRQPNQIYGKKSDGSWADLGTNDSFNTIPLYVYDHNYVPQRATLNREDYSYPTYDGEPYITGGPFQLQKDNEYCYQPLSGKYPARSCTCWFRATIKKTTDADQIIFHTYKSGLGQLKIVWKANGHIEVTTQYKSTHTFQSSNAVGKDNWVDLDFTVYRATNATPRLIFNGVLTTHEGTGSFLSTSPTNYVGDTYVQFKGTISVQMFNRAGDSIRTVTINLSETNGAANNDHSAFNMANLPVWRPGTRWV